MSFTEMQLQDNFEGLAVNYSNYAGMLGERGIMIVRLFTLIRQILL